MSRTLQAIVLASLWLLAAAAHAQTRAWLDRDRIALGESATLNIETDQAGVDAPDYSPLLRDFRLSGNSSSQQYRNINGVASSRTLYALALQPRREGVIGIPGLRIGNRSTQPLALTVTPAANAPADAGAMVFIEAEADAQAPYVQQAVGYTLRLYYATQLISGQLDQPAPQAASLQRVGDDVQYTRDLAGQRYTVVERRYLLIPERSGTLTIPGARFQGRGVDSGFFEGLFGDGQRDLRASGPPRFLQVRPIPANAPQPWLPLRALGLRYLAAPQAARAGEAVTVTIEASADGANAAQMAELQVQATDAATGAAAPVFADPVQADDRFSDGRPQVRLARRFSIVPAQAGSLRIRGPRLTWWDVRAGVARTATLPDISVPVAPGADGAGAAPANAGGDASDSARDWIRLPGVQGAVRPWALVAALFALLWLATLMWGLHRRPHTDAVAARGEPALPRTAPVATLAELRRALDTGTLGDVADMLCAMALPPVAEADALRARLDDAAQVAAIDALQRARWAGGDAAAARAALRAAFKSGPRWRAVGTVQPEPLPPLYPRA